MVACFYTLQQGIDLWVNGAYAPCYDICSKCVEGVKNSCYHQTYNYMYSAVGGGWRPLNIPTLPRDTKAFLIQNFRKMGLTVIWDFRKQAG